MGECHRRDLHHRDGCIRRAPGDTRMRRIVITIGVALAGAAAVVLMWTISPPDIHGDLRKDAATIYCAAPANKASLRQAMAALGSGTSYQRACDALVELSDPALESSAATGPSGQNILLGSSVVAALVTAVFNVRSTTIATRRTRIDSITDTVSDAYKSFNREAQKYVSLLRNQARPSSDDLSKSYQDLIDSLMRLPEPVRNKPLQDAEECHRYLTDPTKWPAGPDPERSVRLKAADEKINQLSQSMSELQSTLTGKRDPA